MPEKNWFEEWFNSPYYHLLYSHRSEQEAEHFISVLSNYLHMPAQSKVLDVACGKGRHSRTFAKLGFNVTGIDLSTNSIAEARKTENEHLHFDVWDMRQTYKANNFDYVVNLFSSFGYFDNDADDAAAINAMCNDLKSNGTLVIDYINTELAIKNMKAREIIPRGDIQFHIQKRVEKGFIKKKIEFLADGEDHSYEEQLKVINCFHFKEMLTNAGLTVTKIFGDYELNDFDPSTSPRLILIAKKNA